jgi:hypothetical protein
MQVNQMLDGHRCAVLKIIYLINQKIGSSMDKQFRNNQKLLGMRSYVWETGKENEGILEPFLFMYTEVFDYLLGNSVISSPDYKEIYLIISDTIENAKKSKPTLSWQKYVYSNFDFGKYQLASNDEKMSLIFECFRFGLSSLYNDTNIESNKIRQVVETIEKYGITVEIPLLTKKIRNIFVQVLFKVPEAPTIKTEYILEIQKIDQKKTIRIKLFDDEMAFANRKLKKIKILKEYIEIYGKKDRLAELKGEVDRYEYFNKIDINDVFNH